MPEKSWFCIGIFTGSLLLQSGIGILASGPVRYHWSRISPALLSFDYTLLVCIFFLLFFLNQYLKAYSASIGGIPSTD
jgi:hypothetical protein